MKKVFTILMVLIFLFGCMPIVKAKEVTFEMIKNDFQNKDFILYDEENENLKSLKNAVITVTDDNINISVKFTDQEKKDFLGEDYVEEEVKQDTTFNTDIKYEDGKIKYEFGLEELENNHNDFTIQENIDIFYIVELIGSLLKNGGANDIKHDEFGMISLVFAYIAITNDDAYASQLGIRVNKENSEILDSEFIKSFEVDLNKFNSSVEEMMQGFEITLSDITSSTAKIKFDFKNEYIPKNKVVRVYVYDQKTNIEDIESLEIRLTSRDTKSFEYTAKDLKPNTKYYVYVIYEDAETGISFESQIKEFTTLNKVINNSNQNTNNTNNSKNNLDKLNDVESPNTGVSYPIFIGISLLVGSSLLIKYLNKKNVIKKL